jgi:predicted permease
MLRTFVHLQSTPTGLAADQVLTARLAVTLQDYPAPGSFGRYLEVLEGRVGRIPGVRSVGFIQYLPLANWGWSGGFQIVGQIYGASSPIPRAELRYVTPGYFRTLGIPMRRGRELTDRDTKDAPLVILVNEALARQYFPNADPVGRATDRGTIVGVAGDVRQTGLDHPAAPEIYYTFAQNTAATSDAGVSMVVNTALPPETLVRAVSDAIHQVNPNQAIFDVSTMRNVIAGSFAEVRFYIWLIGGFAAIAVLLAAAGIYGVMSYAVGARTREFGIRMTFGADGGDIVHLVLGRGACLVTCGLALGATGAIALTQTIRSVVSGATGVDVLTLGGAGAMLSAIALAACVTPARRASKLEAASVMRD